MINYLLISQIFLASPTKIYEQKLILLNKFFYVQILNFIVLSNKNFNIIQQIISYKDETFKKQPLITNSFINTLI